MFCKRKPEFEMINTNKKKLTYLKQFKKNSQ